MSEEPARDDSSIPVPDFIAPCWTPVPGLAGWYVVQRRSAQFTDLYLVRFEGGDCFSEIGAPMGTPGTIEFEGAKWIGLVERP